MIKIRASLKKLIRRLWEMAAYLTAIGAVLISAGAVLFLELPIRYSPTWDWIAPVLTLTGLFFVVFGGVKVIAEDKERRRTLIILVSVLFSIAEKIGADTDKAIDDMRRQIDKWKL